MVPPRVTKDHRMKVILFGASGMVGQGVLRECLRDPEIDAVLSIGRTGTTLIDPKLREIVRKDLANLSDIEDQLRPYDACLFSLGVSSAGMSEQDYRRITYDLTLSVAQTLVRLNPNMIFVYVTGVGTDSSEKSRSMWARVKGATENALLRLPFKAAYMFRPGFIQPLDGIKSKTKLYSAFYAISSPIFPLLRMLAPNYVTTTRELAQAMIAVAKRGFSKPVLEGRDIQSAAAKNTAP
jgi:uncharacterized protein YbjT (DUF2867 family)